MKMLFRAWKDFSYTVEKEIALSDPRMTELICRKRIEFREDDFWTQDKWAVLNEAQIEVIFNSPEFSNPRGLSLLGVKASYFGIDHLLQDGVKYRVLLSATPSCSVFGRGAGSWTVSPTNSDPFEKEISSFSKGDFISDFWHDFDYIKDVQRL